MGDRVTASKRLTSREVVMYRLRTHAKPASSGTSVGSTQGTAMHTSTIAPAQTLTGLEAPTDMKEGVQTAH